MKNLDIDINKIICVNFKSHNDTQLHAVAKTYNISYEFLLNCKNSGIFKMWLPIGGGNSVAELFTKDMNDVRFYPAYLPMSLKTRKAILNIKPVLTPKVKTTTKNVVVKTVEVKSSKVVLEVDAILDKISALGMASLTKEELNFLKNL